MLTALIESRFHEAAPTYTITKPSIMNFVVGCRVLDQTQADRQGFVTDVNDKLIEVLFSSGTTKQVFYQNLRIIEYPKTIYQNNGLVWTMEDEKKLLDNWGLKNEVLAKLLHRTPDAIRTKRKQINNQRK